MDTAPTPLDGMAPSQRMNLAALRSSPRDTERMIAWVENGFNAAAAARARPDLGSEGTIQRTARRYRAALQGIICGICTRASRS